MLVIEFKTAVQCYKLESVFGGVGEQTLTADSVTQACLMRLCVIDKEHPLDTFGM